MVEHRSLHVAVIEIAFNATSADGRPLVAMMPLQAPEPSVEESCVGAARGSSGISTWVAGVMRSAITHAMVMRHVTTLAPTSGLRRGAGAPL